MNGSVSNRPEPTDRDAAGREARAATSDVPWAGVNLDDRRVLNTSVDSLALATPRQIEWYRARMHDPSVEEPGLGFCLERVADAGELTRDDLDRLLVGWEERMICRPDNYQRFRPALITFGIALARDEHPRAREVWEALGVLSEPWQIELRHALTGWFGTPEDLEDLWERVLHGSRYAAIGWVMLASRVHGMSVLDACAMGTERAEAERSRPFVRNYFATTAIAWWSDPPLLPLNCPTRWLWSYSFDESSSRWFDSGVAVARLETLPMVLRSWVLRNLREHMIVTNPARLPQPVGDAEHASAVRDVEQLHARIDTTLT